MTNRVKHRRDRIAARFKRIKDGLPADPSNRGRKQRMPFQCPCGVEHRSMAGIFMHFNLSGHGGAA